MPRMLDLIRASALPSNLMQSAARGALSVPPREMIEILVYLAIHNKVFGEQARLTLAGWDEASSRAVAADPGAPKEVLNYLISPQNLRPVLLPLLFDNPSVTEASLIGLVTASSREVVEAMLKSQRVSQSPKILQALSSNPNLTGIEAAHIRTQLGFPAPESPGALPEKSETPAAAGEVLSEALLDEPTGSDNVLEEALAGYFSEHAGEISAEADTPFQLIGGFYDEFVPGSEAAPALGEPTQAEAVSGAAPSPSATGAAAAPKRAPIVKKSQLSPTERGSALQKISRLDVKGRIQLAMKGNKEERSLLIRDGTKVVALAVLDSPKIGDSEVERFASQKNVLEAVLRGIPLKRRFAKHYGIVRALVFNPRTPIDVSLGQIKHLLVNDLKHLSGNKEVSETIRKLALKMFKQKLSANRKSTD
jgi:hypothetical protein